MGLFSSLFGHSQPPKKPSPAILLANKCLAIRGDNGFLDYYISHRSESPETLMRLKFSQDALLVLMSTIVARNRTKNNQRRQQFNEEVRTHYLRKIPVPSTSLVGDCLACQEELEAIRPFVSPNASLPELRTAIVSTTGLLSLIIDYRAQQFRQDMMDGVLEAHNGAFIFWEPVCKTFLSQIRGTPRDSISP